MYGQFELATKLTKDIVLRSTKFQQEYRDDKKVESVVLIFEKFTIRITADIDYSGTPVLAVEIE